ncbi:MAG: type II toxin-antitoxin system RelE/ParE family toxin [Pyrinomonadaceae bacterium]|nr:type II toxin-antitoxin system RelE/ParE family toxin [Pyrinomonadaceae bacterium]MBP6213667.1 type II toxin-antitoxin system RelE/ParE family toxin [Pyrinomonadaceae bacterium]
MIRAIFTSAASRDVKRALDYYKSVAGVKVASDFVDHLEAKVLRILRAPEAYQVVTKDFRCANLDRFPYQIVYRIASESVVRIISVRHHKQSPDFGLDR